MNTAAVIVNTGGIPIPILIAAVVIGVVLGIVIRVSKARSRSNSRAAQRAREDQLNARIAAVEPRIAGQWVWQSQQQQWQWQPWGPPQTTSMETIDEQFNRRTGRS